MAIRQIRVVEDEILRKKCKEVEVINERTKILIDDMVETMYSIKNAGGLAAPQVGILKRIVVIDMGTGLIKLINPKITNSEGYQEVIEGCLSIPNTFGKLIRPYRVTIEAMDENGREFEFTAEGELAKCFCHEIDHLDGKLFTDFVDEYI